MSTASFRAEGFVRVPGGNFVMGGMDTDKFVTAIELPRREVRVAPFLLAAYPVTEAGWAQYAGRGPCDSTLPVVRITSTEATDYCRWLSGELSMNCRLPTEAEWECAARAGSESIFPSGNDLSPAEANYLYDESGVPVGPGSRTPVGSYPPNALGLHDLAGNVCEWTADAWSAFGDRPGSDHRRVIRGGAWDHLPRLLRISWRDWAPCEARYDNLGFRVAADLPGSSSWN